MAVTWRSGLVLVGFAAAGCRIGFDPLRRDAEPLLSDVDPSASDARGDGAGDGGGDGGGSGSSITLVGPLVTADTALNSAGTALNYGGGTAFNVRNDAISQFTGLLRFELATIAPGTPIVAADLRLTTGNAALASGQVSLYELEESWDEGDQVGATGTASWNDRKSGTAWTAAGAGVGSRASAALATLQPYQTNMQFTVALPASEIQKWVNTPATNFGVALVASGTGMGDSVQFVSSEGTAAAQPTLVVMTGP